MSEMLPLAGQHPQYYDVYGLFLVYMEHFRSHIQLSGVHLVVNGLVNGGLCEGSEF